MEKSEVKSIVIVALALCTILLGTCEVRNYLGKNNAPEQIDTLDLGLYKKAKEAEIHAYQYKLGRLQQVKDSLWFQVTVKKSQFAQARPIVQHYTAQLQKQLAKPDSVCCDPDTLRSIADSLIVYQQKEDSACVETINGLESIVANRDSSISAYKSIETDLRDLQKEQDLKAQYLTEQLNLALKQQKKKTRQNKLLAGSLLLLSGITTAILIPQHIR